jgi:hypothetical protein
MADISKIKLPNGTTYNIKDSSKPRTITLYTYSGILWKEFNPASGVSSLATINDFDDFTQCYIYTVMYISFTKKYVAGLAYFVGGIKKTNSEITFDTRYKLNSTSLVANDIEIFTTTYNSQDALELIETTTKCCPLTYIIAYGSTFDTLELTEKYYYDGYVCIVEYPGEANDRELYYINHIETDATHSGNVTFLSASKIRKDTSSNLYGTDYLIDELLWDNTNGWKRNTKTIVTGINFEDFLYEYLPIYDGTVA